MPVKLKRAIPVCDKKEAVDSINISQNGQCAERRSFTAADEAFMRDAVALARAHLGKTGENPAVGAVLTAVENGSAVIVGRGVTGIGGRPHAEILALRQAGGRAKDSALYVTLEPCCHFGKTPPCADALIKAGVARVVIAVGDPDSRVCGRGVMRLRQAGIKVEIGCLPVLAAADLAPYLCRKKFMRPFITAKLAVSADGFIGRRGEGKLAVSGAESQRNVHDLRAAHKAVLVGIGTVLSDNPRLDCRFATKAREENTSSLETGNDSFAGNTENFPVRVVMDSRLRLKTESYLVRTARRQPVWVFCSESADLEKQKSLRAAGCRVFVCKGSESSVNLRQSLAILSEHGIDSVFLEGGAELMQAFWDNSLIDKLILFKSPLRIGKNGYKKPDFGKKCGYEKLAAQRFGHDIKETWLHIGGEGGLLGSNICD